MLYSCFLLLHLLQSPPPTYNSFLLLVNIVHLLPFSSYLPLFTISSYSFYLLFFLQNILHLLIVSPHFSPPFPPTSTLCPLSHASISFQLTLRAPPLPTPPLQSPPPPSTSLLFLCLCFLLPILSSFYRIYFTSSLFHLFTSHLCLPPRSFLLLLHLLFLRPSLPPPTFISFLLLLQSPPPFCFPPLASSSSSSSYSTLHLLLFLCSFTSSFSHPPLSVLHRTPPPPTTRSSFLLLLKNDLHLLFLPPAPPCPT